MGTKCFAAIDPKRHPAIILGSIEIIFPTKNDLSHFFIFPDLIVVACTTIEASEVAYCCCCCQLVPKFLNCKIQSVLNMLFRTTFYLGLLSANGQLFYSDIFQFEDSFFTT